MKKTRKIFASLEFKIDQYFRSKSINIYYPYNKILAYKNLHKNQRCFIVGTGPSLNINQLDLLQNEITFSMNSIPLSFSKTNWRPTYYVIQDTRAYNIFKDNLPSYAKKEIFIGINHRFNGIKMKKYTNHNFNKYCYYPLYLRPDENIYKIKFSDDCYKIVYDGTTVTYSILQLAVYMGFSEIYLLGMDCDYTSTDKKHFINYVTNFNTLAAENKMLYAYSLTNLYAKEHNIKIFNATTGGKLEIFPRVKLEDILNKK